MVAIRGTKYPLGLEICHLTLLEVFNVFTVGFSRSERLEILRWGLVVGTRGTQYPVGLKWADLSPHTRRGF